MPYNEKEIYTTSEESEAYELARRLVVEGIRSHVVDNTRYLTHPTFKVICDDPSKYKDSRVVRKIMLGS